MNLLSLFVCAHCFILCGGYLEIAHLIDVISLCYEHRWKLLFLSCIFMFDLGDSLGWTFFVFIYCLEKQMFWSKLDVSGCFEVNWCSYVWSRWFIRLNSSFYVCVIVLWLTWFVFCLADTFTVQEMVRNMVWDMLEVISPTIGEGWRQIPFQYYFWIIHKDKKCVLIHSGWLEREA